MQPNTRRLVQFTLPTANIATDETLDMLCSKNGAADWKAWLEARGNLAEG